MTDNKESTEGIGSRFFAVSNGAGVTAEELAETAGHADSGPQTFSSASCVLAPGGCRARFGWRRTSLAGRRGWDLSAPLRTFDPDDRGRVVVRSEEVNRVELHLGPGHTRRLSADGNDGHAGLARSGRTLDATTGVFTWAPGVGFRRGV